MQIEQKDKFDKKDFAVGFDGEARDCMIVSIPLRVCADDIVNGTAILRGKLEEIKGLAIGVIKQMRDKKEQSGIIKPIRNGNPAFRVVN